MYKRSMIILLLAIIVIFISCGKDKESKNNQNDETQNQRTNNLQSKITKIEDTFSKKYNAKIYPEEIYQNEVNFTIQLQKLFINSNRPIVFLGSLYDIFVENSEYYIRFVIKYNPYSKYNKYNLYRDNEFHFILKGNQAQINLIINAYENRLKDRKYDESEFALYYYYGRKLYYYVVVVAKIDNVTKLISVPENKFSETRIRPENDIMIFRGDFIDLEYVDTSF